MIHWHGAARDDKPSRSSAEAEELGRDPPEYGAQLSLTNDQSDLFILCFKNCNSVIRIDAEKSADTRATPLVRNNGIEHTHRGRNPLKGHRRLEADHVGDIQ